MRHENGMGNFVRRLKEVTSWEDDLSIILASSSSSSSPSSLSLFLPLLLVRLLEPLLCLGYNRFGPSSEPAPSAFLAVMVVCWKWFWQIRKIKTMEENEMKVIFVAFSWFFTIWWSLVYLDSMIPRSGCFSHCYVFIALWNKTLMFKIWHTTYWIQ